jgi:hypothetical protein
VLTSAADLALFTAASPGETIALELAMVAGGNVVRGGGGTVHVSTRVGGDVSICYARRQVEHAGSVGLALTNWQQAIVVPKHDPAVGPLRSVRVVAHATLSGRARVETLEPVANFAAVRLAALVRVDRPGGNGIVGVEPTQVYSDYFQPFDGTIDFDGPSGVSHSPVVVHDVARVVLEDPTDLALFTASVPGETIALEASAAGTSSASGPGPIAVLFESSAAVEIDVRYDYGAPIVIVCAGDGSSGACPCGNASPTIAQAGCLNSLGLGATLRASGAGEIGDDDLVLTAAGLPMTASTLFFQGTTAVTAAFGDGLRCAGGSVVRLGTTTAIGGVATFPPAGTTVSQAGGATPGATLHYQGWYRNAASFCTSAAFNTTNALSIAW